MNSVSAKGLIVVSFLSLFLLPVFAADEKKDEEKDKIQSLTEDRKRNSPIRH